MEFYLLFRIHSVNTHSGSFLLNSFAKLD